MTVLNGKASNPADPMWKDAPERAKYLNRRFAEAADQFSTEDVINAAGSLLVTALRQAHGTKAEVERNYDEIAGRMKTILLSHYDSISGRKKGVFPYDQVIAPPLLVSKNGFPH